MKTDTILISQHEEKSEHYARGPQRFLPNRPGLLDALAIFAGVLLLVAGTAAWLLHPQASPAAAGETVTVTMAGFQPAELKVPAGQPATVRLINPDSSFHTDGGGVHQFAAPELGVDVKFQPESEAVVEIPASQPATYTFYCDVCCGGKENPAMRGAVVS